MQKTSKTMRSPGPWDGYLQSTFSLLTCMLAICQVRVLVRAKNVQHYLRLA